MSFPGSRRFLTFLPKREDVRVGRQGWWSYHRNLGTIWSESFL